MDSNLHEDDLHNIIMDVLEWGILVFTSHAKDQMGLRGYTVHDVMNILRGGEIIKMTEKSTGRYHCEVHGHDIDGDPGAVVALVIKRSRIVIITVLGGV